jgi:hypothetical protein
MPSKLYVAGPPSSPFATNHAAVSRGVGTTCRCYHRRRLTLSKEWSCRFLRMSVFLSLVRWHFIILNTKCYLSVSNQIYLYPGFRNLKRWQRYFWDGNIPMDSEYNVHQFVFTEIIRPSNRFPTFYELEQAWIAKRFSENVARPARDRLTFFRPMAEPSKSFYQNWFDLESYYYRLPR